MIGSGKIIPIVLTGGPGAGKTEALAYLQKNLSSKALGVVVIPETASELILAGLSPRNALANADFQRAQLALQLAREAIYARAAEKRQEPQILLVMDRGALDGNGFIDDKSFVQILKEQHLSQKDLLSRYAAVFHLTSAAREQPDQYSLSNNQARAESIRQAAKEDERLLKIYQDHPYRKIIPAYPKIEDKYRQLLQEIRIFLNQTKPPESSS